MISQTTDCLYPDIGSDFMQLLAQQSHINLCMIFYCIGVIAPYTKKDGFLGQAVVGAGIQPSDAIHQA